MFSRKTPNDLTHIDGGVEIMLLEGCNWDEFDGYYDYGIIPDWLNGD